MAFAVPLVWLVLGASLLGVLARVAIPSLAWIAVALLVHGTRSLPAAPGLTMLWIALYASLAIGNRGMIPLGGVAYFVVLLMVATGTALPFIVDRIVAPRLGTWQSTLILPLAFVTVELLASRFGPSGSWGSLAYTQSGSIALMQSAAFVGLWGITFLVAWFGATVELLWSRGWNASEVRAPVVTFGAVLVVTMLAGAIRVALAPDGRPSIRVATLTMPIGFLPKGAMTLISEGGVQPTERSRVSDELRRVHDWFLDGSRREARAGARLVVWPEQNLLVFASDEGRFLERATHLAREERVWLAMGLGTVHLGEPRPLENKLVLVDPAGSVILSYLKSNPVPGWEASIIRRGDGRLPVVATEEGRIAAAICYDADFPAFMRQAGAGAADLLLVPANDWRAIGTMHAQIAAFRAIENGVSLVRPAASGISTVVDPWGRVLATSDYFSPGDRAMTAQLPLGGVRTLYARTGDLFGWICVAALVVVLATSAVSR